MAEDFQTRFPKCNHLYVISKDHPQTPSSSSSTSSSSGAGASRLSIADITTVQHSPAHTPNTDYTKVTVTTNLVTIQRHHSCHHLQVPPVELDLQACLADITTVHFPNNDNHLKFRTFSDIQRS